MATEPEPQGPARLPLGPQAQGGRRAGTRGSSPMGGLGAPPVALPTTVQSLPGRGGDSTPEWLEPAMAANGIGSFDWDIRRDLIEADQRACGFMGVRGCAPELSSEDFLALLHPEDAPVVRRRVERAVAELGQCGAYYRTVFPGGELHAVRFRGRVLADAFGRPSRMVGFLWDATAELHKREDAGRQAALREDRSRFIKEAARALSEAVTVRDVARVFTELPLPGLPPDGLVLAAMEAGRLRILGASGYRSEHMVPFDRMPLEPFQPAAEAIRSRLPLFLASQDEYRERFPQAWPKVIGTGRSAWAYLPLVASGRTIGLCLVSFDDSRELDADERTLLSTLGGLVAQSLARARLHDAEHELAAGLQRVMLPRNVPAVPGVTTAVRYLPAGSGLQIGGDWYDVVPLPGGHVGLVIGDVQGHDVHAAGIMGQLRIALRAYAAEGHPPAAVMARASRFLADLDTDHFATCTYAEVNVDYGVVYAVRAGHLDPVVRRADGTSTVQSVVGGLPLGIGADQEYQVTRFSLDPGETVVLCTDGLVESRGLDLDTGMARLCESVAGELGSAGDGASDPIEELADRIAARAADPAEREDDIALLLLRWDGPEGGLAAQQLRRRIGQADLARVAELRGELRDALRRWGVPELIDTAELLASELVTNAIRHTDRDAMFTARLYREDGREPRLRIEVEDESDLWPKRRTPGEQASSGRGLMLVEALADAWGVEPRGSGKRMWFELSAPPVAEAA
ncbi:serine phosphatase RsbU (regulator of sigma subunit)/anti-sigma regulatory factor (Ser/Thr protein kinase) [Kitasatospora sp. GAS204A]|uniref:ATP-binding SpoIIE family protein phosphatase n=1 Tax=unclassified Kitasatospora TaxID=2633591 RepID=UPI0024755D89|nr:SpoIIE family protein phosphatase [Kitasatospora sp. GAS204B]MDH6116102.1 serine phosphatase RsbU (regulator of sigma subunit)/anti-sigma regulatory factor (Ser/Thr protein kinase) [Kitasatospora sp. GAS204B]